MDDLNLHTAASPDNTTSPLPDAPQSGAKGPAENTSAKGVSLPGTAAEPEAPQSAEPASEHTAPLPENAAQDAPPADTRSEDTAAFPPPDMIACPRCGNLIPYENFCPVCTFSLRGMPPAQSAPPPVYSPYAGVVPPVANRPQPPYGYAQQTTLYPQQPPPPPWQGAAHSYAPAPPQPPRADSSRWPMVTAIVMGSIMLVIQLIMLIVLAYGVSLLDAKSSPESGNNFLPGGEYTEDGLLPDNILPQYFIGDTVIKGDVVYDFDYCFSEEDSEDASSLVVVGVTFKNNSSATLTLTPSLFRLEDASGNPCEYAAKRGGVSAKDVLERTVLMPGEKVSKLLLYSVVSGDYDYLPLYVLDPSGRELFYVYLSLHS